MIAAMRYGAGSFDRFDLDVFAAAQALLRAHWPDVERLAIVLLDRVTVKGYGLADPGSGTDP